MPKDNAMTNDIPALSMDSAPFDTLHAILTSGDIAGMRDLIAANPSIKSDLIDYASAFIGVSNLAGDDHERDPGAGHSEPSQEARDALSRHLVGMEMGVGDVFAGLGAVELVRVADHCLIDSDILRQIARRRIDAGTVPGRFVALLAEAMGQGTATIFAHLADEAEVLTGDRFAPSGLTQGGKISFAEAVRTSSLEDERKRFWLGKVGG